MTLFLQNDTGGAGSGNVFPNNAFADLLQISKMDLGLGQDPPAAGSDLIKMTYQQSQMGTCPNRLNTLVNTNFPDVPADPIDIIVLAVDNAFVFANNVLMSATGPLTLPPAFTDSNGVRM